MYKFGLLECDKMKLYQNISRKKLASKSYRKKMKYRSMEKAIKNAGIIKIDANMYTENE